MKFKKKINSINDSKLNTLQLKEWWSNLIWKSNVKGWNWKKKLNKLQ